MENQITAIISVLKSALLWEIALVVLLVLGAILAASIKKSQDEAKARTLLLTSSGLDMKKEILKLLQKPPYNTSVAVITTASKPEENKDYIWKDLQILHEDMGFSVEQIDIEGKKEGELLQMLQVKDLIFVEGGNTFYLLKAMRACNFEKVVKQLLKKGIVYVGVSAGSIVAGRTIQTADNFGTGTRNHFGVKDLKGLNLVNFDILPHYSSEKDTVIKQKMPNAKKRQKKLKILADGQAILVQGKDVYYLGTGEPIVVA